MRDLTERQYEILEFIQQQLRLNNVPPTRSEIASHFLFKSPNAAEQHLRALEKKGYLKLTSNKSRGIQVLMTEEELLAENQLSSVWDMPQSGLWVIGQVAAGSPILAQENREMPYQIDPSIFKPRADYLLRVKGWSMRDAGILPNDLLAVHQTQEVYQGAIVVARIEEEVTVKRFHRLNDTQVQLLPANPEFEPILVDLSRQQLMIEGIGVGVLRNW